MQIIADADYDRRKFIGGSKVAAVMGLGAYSTTPLTAYLYMVGEGPEEVDPKRELFLQRRKRWEGPIVEMLREEFDAKIVSVNVRYQDDEFPFMAAELDFEWEDAEGNIQNGEIKTVSPFAFGENDGWGEPGTSDIPVHYAAQVMHGLGITGRQVCIVVAMVGLDSMIFYRVERDDETIAAMRAHLADFWNDNVIARVPPEPVSFEDCLKLTLRLRGKPVEIDEALFNQIGQIAAIRGSKKAMEGEEDEIKFHILNAIRKAWMLEPTAEPKDNAVLLYKGRKVATYNMQSATRIDSERLRAEQAAIAAIYSKTSHTRVLRISK